MTNEVTAHEGSVYLKVPAERVSSALSEWLDAATAGGFKPVRAKRVYLSDEGDLIIEIADAQPV